MRYHVRHSYPRPHGVLRILQLAATMLTNFALAAFAALTSATILQNGQVRTTAYPNITIPAILGDHNSSWTTYGPGASELSYKGRWDEKYISWWSAPGLKFGFRAEQVAISFGNYTSEGVLVAYRLDGLDWMLTNVTANSTNLFITPATTGYNLSTPANGPRTLELRVTNWAYGVQIKAVHLAGGRAELVKVPDYSRRMEIIGDSLSSGYTDTLEGISSYAWGLAYGFGDTEFAITAFPGICVTDKECFGNPRGQSFQWDKTVDTSGRAVEIYGDSRPLLHLSYSRMLTP